MGGSTREEEGVLKLVHPGRYVELHRQPVTAAEVMRRNPRHCIARPDVFRFPWIVVRPESVLVPGSVFYIVPNTTIYGLLKAREHQNQNQIITLSNDTSLLNSSSSSSAGMTPMHQNHNRCLLFIQIQKKNTTVPPQSYHQNYYSQPKLIMKRRKEEAIDDEDDGSGSKGSGRAILPHGRNNGNLQMRRRRCQQPILNYGLKSCLRKEDSVRKSHNLRVTFVLIACNNNTYD